MIKNNQYKVTVKQRSRGNHMSDYQLTFHVATPKRISQIVEEVVDGDTDGEAIEKARKLMEGKLKRHIWRAAILVSILKKVELPKDLLRWSDA